MSFWIRILPFKPGKQSNEKNWSVRNGTDSSVFKAFFKEICISSKTNLKKNKQKFTNFLVRKVKPDLIRIWPGQKVPDPTWPKSTVSDRFRIHNTGLSTCMVTVYLVRLFWSGFPLPAAVGVAVALMTRELEILLDGRDVVAQDSLHRGVVLKMSIVISLTNYIPIW